MKTSLDCLPCFVRQSLDAARFVTPDVAVHEEVMREVLRMTADLDLHQAPPVVAQRIHRRLRELTGIEDPYAEVKNRFNQIALGLLPELTAIVKAADDPFLCAVRLAIAGNIIDLGANSQLSEKEVLRSVAMAQQEPFFGDVEEFREAVRGSGRILYITDNAGEIVFDRLLVEQLSASRVIAAVRGTPIINDATLADAQAAGLNQLVKVIDSGSDAPGILLDDCGPEFRDQFEKADLIIAKGQGNFETLSDNPRRIFFLLKIKCPVVADHTGLAVGTQALLCPTVGSSKNGEGTEAKIDSLSQSPVNTLHHFPERGPAGLQHRRGRKLGLHECRQVVDPAENVSPVAPGRCFDGIGRFLVDVGFVDDHSDRNAEVVGHVGDAPEIRER